MSDPALANRIERIEAQLEIGQLPARYAVAVDGRDLDGLVGLFVEDVNCGRWGTGRDALKRYYDEALRGFYRSVHLVCGQTIDLVDADRATGTVYCRAEHEDGGSWVVMAICYFDQYERREGRWYFVRREERHWYATDAERRPQAPGFQAWPGRDDPRERPRLPHRFPTWEGFWAGDAPENLARRTAEP